LAQFQPTHPHGVRLFSAAASAELKCFNPRTRTGCDLVVAEIGYIVAVSTHAPARGATVSDPIPLYRCPVSTHAPARGATRTAKNPNDRTASFNPRTRTGCDAVGLGSGRTYDVSTHAPARGATWENSAGARREVVSTHAPARGATRDNRIDIAGYAGFNPRTRTGCDELFIAIPRTRTCFNPRTRTGCDSYSLGCVWESRCFNPRTRTGCDTSGRADPPLDLSFNPRTRTGCDGACIATSYLHIPVSTHAPARGATRISHIFSVYLQFQPTHPHGVRRHSGQHSKATRGFNPRTRTGCDPENDTQILSNSLFQPTHPHGVRQVHRLQPAGILPRFNPRTRTGCDSLL